MGDSTPKCQPLSSSLSVDAAEFVPGSYTYKQGTQTNTKDGTGGIASLAEIPPYITNCYPFVQTDQPNRTNSHHMGEARGRGHTCSGRGGKIGGMNVPGRPLPPAAGQQWGLNHMAPHFVPGVQSIPGMTFDGGTDLGDGLLPTPTIFPPLFPPGINGTYPNHVLDFTNFGRGFYPGIPNRGRGFSSGKQHGNRFFQNQLDDGRPWQQDISIGYGDPFRNIPGSWSRTRTIIMKDGCVQTDFSNEIASLTLSDKPSPLFLHSRARRRKDQNCNLTLTSDSEEVDSDSGYSSPLHRRNLRSSGTHPVCASDRGVFPEELKTKTESDSPKIQLLSCACIAQNNASPHTTRGGDNTAPRESTFTLCDKQLSNSPTHIIASPDRTEHSAICDPKPEESEVPAVKKKKRRRRNRRKKKRTTEDDKEGQSDGLSVTGRTFSSSNVSRTSDVTLHFEDEDEFPDLYQSNVDSSHERDVTSNKAFMSYSQIVKMPSSPISPGGDNSQEYISAPSVSLEDMTDGSQEKWQDQQKETKSARKRRKRRELANKAAEVELAEISLEQQMLKEIGLKQKPLSTSQDDAAHDLSTNDTYASVSKERKTAWENEKVSGIITKQAVVKEATQKQGGGGGKKSNQPIALDIAAMIDALEKKKKEVPEPREVKRQTFRTEEKQGSTHNTLDSSAPAKRGKERENPKPKKPSPLKKVILKEREEKKKLRMLDEDLVPVPHHDDLACSITEAPVGIGVVNAESDLSQDALSSKSSMETGGGASTSADLSPISQTSPISMSPLSPAASPLSSGVNSPIAGNIGKEANNPAMLKIHSRRFREYCNQILDKDIDTCCTDLLQDLVRFQDRMYHKDPVKAKARRRIVLGLREVTKHLRLKKIKCVIISPNLEKIQSKGGLDDALNNILNMCTEQNVPFIFALGRRALGRACAKLVPVSVAGVFNYEGCEENFHKLIEYTEKARQTYNEMVQSIEKEIEAHPHRIPPTAFPNLFAHMGHSRTPSGCSAISFTSSILSEPISENYPYSEPETDSKGYEIVKEAGENDRVRGRSKDQSRDVDTTMLANPPLAVHEIDEGNEADTEDCNDILPTVNPIVIDNNESSSDEDNDEEEDDEEDYGDNRMENGNVNGHVENDDDTDEEEDDDDDDDDDEDSQHASDTIHDLPHIDSIHSNSYDLSAEILSQHSGRTLDSSEVMSTHSSRTVGDGSSTVMADVQSVERQKLDVTKICDSPAGSSGSHRLKIMDKDRIQSWVDTSPLCLEGLHESSDADATTNESACTESENEIEGQGHTLVNGVNGRSDGF